MKNNEHFFIPYRIFTHIIGTCVHILAYFSVLLPEDVRRWIRAEYQTGQVQAGGVIHVQLLLAGDLSSRLYKTYNAWLNLADFNIWSNALHRFSFIHWERIEWIAASRSAFDFVDVSRGKKKFFFFAEKKRKIALLNGSFFSFFLFVAPSFPQMAPWQKTTTGKKGKKSNKRMSLRYNNSYCSTTTAKNARKKFSPFCLMLSRRWFWPFSLIFTSLHAQQQHPGAKNILFFHDIVCTQ